MVADHDSIGDDGGLLQFNLHQRRGDVLTPGSDDDVLLAVGDEQKPILVDMADVAGVQEPFLIESFGGRLGIAQVAEKIVGTASQISPSWAIASSIPGRAGPTEPIRFRSGRLKEQRPVHSD